MMRAQWSALEAMYKAGKTRAIGVSNFCAACLDCIMGGSSEVPPAGASKNLMHLFPLTNCYLREPRKSTFFVFLKNGFKGKIGACSTARPLKKQPKGFQTVNSRVHVYAYSLF